MGEEWKPKDGEGYWYIGTYSIQHAVNAHDDWDKYCIENNNYFRTRQLARDAKKAIQEVLKKARKS